MLKWLIGLVGGRMAVGTMVLVVVVILALLHGAGIIDARAVCVRLDALLGS